MNAYMFNAMRILLVLACLVLVVSASAKENQTLQQAEVITITMTVPASSTQPTPITANSGSKFAITLEANHTTGYQWRLGNQPDEKIVKSAGSIYNEPHSGLMGAGGTETWTFQAVSKGTTQIMLEYARPWEKDVKPIKTQEFAVSVQ